MKKQVLQDAARPRRKRAAQRSEAANVATFADLFCGIGGFHYAASSLGLRCVFACDIDQDASAQYEHNFGIRPLGDITDIAAKDIPDHDVLFAGFPCQPFSIIGSRKGMSDSRGMLFLDIMRVLSKKRPKAIVLENVKQFSTISNGGAIERVIAELENLGYCTDWRILNALDFGLPQKREHCIIVGLAGEGMQRFAWPSPAKRRKSLSCILEDNPDPRYFASERILKSRRQKHRANEQPMIWHENKGGNISSHPYSCALRAGASYNYLLVNGERRLTPRELLRLQGFPDRFQIIGNYSQIRKQTGNAVPVPMVRAVIREVIHASNS